LRTSADQMKYESTGKRRRIQEFRIKARPRVNNNPPPA
jgi:hypothetical protein